ncbi:helix-turn-helix domain-containing protein [Hwangdonia sp.]|uniref:helix-turn-helix domain-containing protein n=1 Tax=Hwangdonia sp. TaxID=1883432 RepID=UPI003AB70797
MNLSPLPQPIETSILIWVGAIGLFIIFLMLFSRASNKMVNVYLVGIFVIGSIRNLVFGITYGLDYNPLLNFKFISPIFLLVAPCLFLYFKSLVKDSKCFNLKNLVHFAFPASILALNLSQEYLNILNHSIIEDLKVVLIVVFFILYIVLSYSLLKKNLWNQNINSFIEPRHYLLIKDWTYFAFVIACLMFLRIIYSIYIEKISHAPLQGYKFSWVTVFPWLLIYGRVLITPEILYGCPQLKKRTITNYDNLNINDSAWIYDEKVCADLQSVFWQFESKNIVLPYILDLEKFINKNHPFRDKKFSFQDLADVIEIPVSHLHFIFKYRAVLNFKEYKESCMINDAKQLIDNGDLDISNLEKLYLKVGFSNYNEFITTFNKFTGCFPEDYLIPKQCFV